METDLEFYTRRAQEERKAAGRAASPEAKAAHEALADTYSRKARDEASKEKLADKIS